MLQLKNSLNWVKGGGNRVIYMARNYSVILLVLFLRCPMNDLQKATLILFLQERGGILTFVGNNIIKCRPHFNMLFGFVFQNRLQF